MQEDTNPTARIYAVIATGFLSGPLAGLAYVGPGGVVVAIRLDLLSVVGGFLWLGFLGMLGGTLVGLSVQLLAQKWARSRGSWWAALAASAVSGFALGWGFMKGMAGLALGFG